MQFYPSLMMKRPCYYCPTTTRSVTAAVTASLVFLLVSATPLEARRSNTFLVTTKATNPPLTFRGGSSSSFNEDPLAYQDSTTTTPPSGYDPYAYNYDIDDNEQQPEDFLHETVQHRVDTWKMHQRQAAEQMQTSPRDEQGRMKLLTSVGKGSRALIFFFLMWRNVHLYEVADQATKGVRRLVLVIPLVLLFFGNLMGVVSSLSSPGHAAKRRLKAILNMDKLVETLLILYSFIRLTVAPSKYVPRELYITNILHSFLFILQCQGFTRLSWDEHAAQPLNTYARQHHPQSPPPYVQQNAQQEDDEDDVQPPGDSFGYENPFGRQGY